MWTRKRAICLPNVTKLAGQYYGRFDAGATGLAIEENTFFDDKLEDSTAVSLNIQAKQGGLQSRR